MLLAWLLELVKSLFFRRREEPARVWFSETGLRRR